MCLPKSTPRCELQRTAKAILLTAALYLGAVGLYAAPPLTEWRLVAGLMLGLKAQILFMAPFTAAFSRLIGGTRVTNTLTAALCSAPLVGASLGTAAAPLFLAAADTPLSLLVALPSVVAICPSEARVGFVTIPRRISRVSLNSSLRNPELVPQLRELRRRDGFAAVGDGNGDPSLLRP